jgi:replicative DNA helicase
MGEIAKLGNLTSPLKQPPHSIEAEMSVLGGLMLDNKQLDALALQPGDFYRRNHQLIFESIRDVVREKGETCDFVVLSEHLRNSNRLDEAGGMVYLASLVADTHSVANLKAYAEIVKERATLRAVIAYGADASEAGYRPDGRTPTEIIAEFMARLDNLHRRRASKVRTFAEVIDIGERAMDEHVATRKAGRLVGAPFGVPCIDHKTGGLVSPRFWILAGRPSLGKSALLNQFAVHASGHGFPGYMASLEMDEAEIGARARACAAGVNVTRLSFGAQAEREASAGAAAQLGSLPIYVDTASVELDEIVAQIVAAKVQHGIKWAAVDNIQLVEVPSRGRHDRVQELSLVSRTLKKLTIKLGIGIIAVSHLNRAVEKDRRRPSLSDLKDCGSLEQDADVVCFLHSDDDDNVEDKKMQISFGKNRGGRKGSCTETVVFRGATQRFDEITEQEAGP